MLERAEDFSWKIDRARTEVAPLDEERTQSDSSASGRGIGQRSTPFLDDAFHVSRTPGHRAKKDVDWRQAPDLGPGLRHRSTSIRVPFSKQFGPHRCCVLCGAETGGAMGAGGALGVLSRF